MDDRDPARALEEIGRRIAELRERAGLTQAQIAERMGTTTSNYQRIEHGAQNVTVATLLRIADALGGVPIRSLFATPRRRRRGPGRPAPRRR